MKQNFWEIGVQILSRYRRKIFSFFLCFMVPNCFFYAQILYTGAPEPYLYYKKNYSFFSPYSVFYFRVWYYHGEMGLRQVEQGFSSFLPNSLGILDDFSKWSLCQKIKKSLVQLAINTFLHSTSQTRNLGFRYPIRQSSLVLHNELKRGKKSILASKAKINVFLKFFSQSAWKN